MIVLWTNLIVLAIGSLSTSSGDLELVYTWTDDNNSNNNNEDNNDYDDKETW